MIRIEIENADGPREITNYSKEFTASFSKEDDRRYDYTLKLKEITLLGEDYEYFASMEASDNRCNLNTLKIYVLCGLSETLKYQGVFAMNNGKWDLDRCKVTFEIKTNDAYTCLDDNDVTYNLFDLVPDRVTTGLSVVTGIESYACVNGGSIDIPACDDQFLEDGLWTYWEHRTLRDEDVQGNQIGTTGKIYIRDYMITDCDFEASSEWQLEEACSNGTKKYIKKHIIQPGETIEIDDSELGQTTVTNETVTDIDNGMSLRSVLQSLLDEMCPGQYTLKSNFFQWNADDITSINYVTGEENPYRNLILFQKSDVKRPNTSNNATKAETKFFDLFNDILTIFNLEYRVKDGFLRMEHKSYFENELGINLITQNRLERLKGTRKYGYDKNALVKYEKFSFMEADNPEFVGTDIIYDSGCVINDGIKENDIKAEKITTDLFHVMANSASDSELVSDDGFVLMACDPTNNIISTDAVLGPGQILNGPLSWAYIHDKLYRHGRVLIDGNMNGVDQTFESTVPILKQDQFGAILSCKEILQFEPTNQIKGMLGWGFIESAELNLNTCNLSLNLKLQKISRDINVVAFGDFDENFDENFD